MKALLTVAAGAFLFCAYLGAIDKTFVKRSPVTGTACMGNKACERSAKSASERWKTEPLVPGPVDFVSPRSR